MSIAEMFEDDPDRSDEEIRLLEEPATWETAASMVERLGFDGAKQEAERYVALFMVAIDDDRLAYFHALATALEIMHYAPHRVPSPEGAGLLS